MAKSYKILGQVNPTIDTATTLYTVPSSTDSIVSTINICNSGSAATTCRVAAVPSGESLSLKHYLVYNATVSANDSISLTIGVTMTAGDLITVYASTGSVAFSAFGSEIV